ncbi:DUF371 domain-containing protein [Streptomyces liangshanensis]|uniref:DUF371 domain-containing protein n=1 Tax=Streptomyces liangshanensis TaxID=2717324 RepID=A0A6G9H3G4_9ACTN|nr:DUF371 domain-containing protein [Streptomyces liangshanensis]QIQ04771.1 DUF371 domain-containing protein [Streptomyces liangshanensis]
MSAELMRLRCRGHRDIRATHTKTLEFTTSSDITGRATCVIGVGATIEGPAPARLAGPLRITLSVGDHRFTVRALANSAWRPGSGAVVRLSSERLPNTLATDADRASADLPRELLHALTDPDAEITIVVARDTEAADGRLVLYRAGDERDDRLAAEIAAADTVIAEDAGAGQVITALGADADPWDSVLPSVAAGGRVLAVSTEDTRSAPVGKLLAARDRPAVEVIGLPAELAVAALSPHPVPVLLAPHERRRQIGKLLGAHRLSRVVFRAPAAELPKILDEAGRTLGARTAAVTAATAAAAERPWWGPVAEAAARVTGGGDVLCCVDPAEEVPEGAEDSDVDLSALVGALAAQSVSSKTLALALATLPTWSRKRAYDFVLEAAKARQPAGPDRPDSRATKG